MLNSGVVPMHIKIENSGYKLRWQCDNIELMKPQLLSIMTWKGQWDKLYICITEFTLKLVPKYILLFITLCFHPQHAFILIKYNDRQRWGTLATLL